MGHTIETRVLDEDVQTVQECTRRRAAVSIGLCHVGNKLAPVELRVFTHKPMLESDRMHDYGGNWPGEQLLSREGADNAVCGNSEYPSDGESSRF